MPYPPPPTARPGSVLDEAVPYAPVPLVLTELVRHSIRLGVQAGLLHRDCLAVFEASIRFLDYETGRLSHCLETLRRKVPGSGGRPMSKSHLCRCLAALEAFGVLTRWRRYRLVPAPAGWRSPLRQQQMTTAYLWHLAEDPAPEEEEEELELEVVAPLCESPERPQFLALLESLLGAPSAAPERLSPGRFAREEERGPRPRVLTGAALAAARAGRSTFRP